jgi:hypothetical protein
MAQVVEYLTSPRKAPSSNPSTSNNNKNQGNANFTTINDSQDLKQ